ncbi:dGTP triphosphohydrolase [Tropicibacter sp. Alg240-R139]|uniref:dGTP triphosphohydrolase n=1 Tax=Tropicibacter sp. Alg240-R139 TaxID=2305991 RepID=UPI0013DFB84F|nr:dNTP triphosphohydrolase [Tropicibacter sp. Alg240-R139]
MAKMEWAKLLDTSVFDGKPEQPDRPAHVIAADRITFSAPFRRLANKTQVHPLYDNDHLRHRLIHSEEVASVGRSIGMQVGTWLATEENLIPEAASHKVAGIIQAACLAHDVGNPPFGHSGEEAIGAWCAEQLQGCSPAFRGIAGDRWHEFERFEGNAQGFRILTRLEMYRNEGGMCLPNAVLGAFTKYPMGAETSKRLKASGKKPYVGAKKFGFFEAERAYYEAAANAMELIETEGADGQKWWRRHPLVYLVEAADDICYNIVDLEDGFSSGDLSLKTVEELLSAVAIPTRRNQGGYTDYEKISYLRARAIGGAINACVQAFKDNHDAILDGSFSSSLIEESGKAAAFKEIKDLAHEQLFTAPRKTKLEVQGRNVIRRVLDGLCPVYEALAKSGWQQADLPSYERQVVSAVQLDLRDVTDAYSAMHSLTDFVSGMTDRYAVKTADLL